MIDGLILLVFIGALAALLIVRVRKKMSLSVSGKTWFLVIVWAVILGLVLYAAAQSK
jgi:hypothetical protein